MGTMADSSSGSSAAGSSDIFLSDEKAASSREDMLRKHFEQKSTEAKGDEFTTQEGVRFRVMGAQPEYGGVFLSTQLNCAGPPLLGCSQCGALAVRRCQSAGCGKLLCNAHMQALKLLDGTK